MESGHQIIPVHAPKSAQSWLYAPDAWVLSGSRLAALPSISMTAFCRLGPGIQGEKPVEEVAAHSVPAVSSWPDVVLKRGIPTGPAPVTAEWLPFRAYYQVPRQSVLKHVTVRQ